MLDKLKHVYLSQVCLVRKVFNKFLSAHRSHGHMEFVYSGVFFIRNCSENSVIWFVCLVVCFFFSHCSLSLGKCLVAGEASLKLDLEVPSDCPGKVVLVPGSS